MNNQDSHCPRGTDGEQVRDHAMIAARLATLSKWTRYGSDVIRFNTVYRRYQRWTMIPRSTYIANLILAARTVRQPCLDSGCIVECGTWKGGMAAGLIEVGGRDRDYWFFDSFEGMPPAREIDGPAALAWQADVDSPGYHDNCSAPLAGFSAVVARAGCLPERLHVVKGWFEETLPACGIPPIAVLRLDADWYESTTTCLTHLWPRVLPGGLILVDDYYILPVAHAPCMIFCRRDRPRSASGKRGSAGSVT